MTSYTDWRVRNHAEANVALAKVYRAAALVLAFSCFTCKPNGVIRLEHHGYNVKGKPLGGGDPGPLNLDAVGIARLLGRHLDRNVADVAVVLLADAARKNRDCHPIELAWVRIGFQEWADDLDPIDTGPPLPLAEQIALFLKQARDENWDEQIAPIRKGILARGEREAANGGNR